MSQEGDSVVPLESQHPSGNQGPWEEEEILAVFYRKHFPWLAGFLLIKLRWRIQDE